MKVLGLARTTGEIQHRAESIGASQERFSTIGLVGGPDQVVDQIGSYTDVGTDTLYLECFDSRDVDQLEHFASAVLSQLA
jgi:alkanesulfonate monooxygenase SsuD/methylene tetrahydromethanopterin reductase-like flavin-dependent oxidoreductase (luciferase family)